MASITIRSLDDTSKRSHAPEQGRSMAKEVPESLPRACGEPALAAKQGLALHRRSAALGGVELDPAPRELIPERPRFD